MPKIKVKGQTIQTGEFTQTHGRTDGRTDGRYQTYYLPSFAVNNKEERSTSCTLPNKTTPDYKQTDKDIGLVMTTCRRMQAQNKNIRQKNPSNLTCGQPTC